MLEKGVTWCYNVWSKDVEVDHLEMFLLVSEINYSFIYLFFNKMVFDNLAKEPLRSDSMFCNHPSH